MERYDLRLKTFFRMMVVGPSGSGKTVWTANFLRSNLIDVKPNKVILYYNIWQSIYQQLGKEGLVDTFRKGVPSLQDILNLSVHKDGGGSLVIIDDQLPNMTKELAEIFMVAGRHSGVSIIFLSQNLFPKEPWFRNVSLQSTYLALMKNPRDASSIAHLAKQLKPGQTRFLTNVFADATENPYSYLFVDLHQQTPEKMRFRSRILKGEEPQIAYVPK